MPDLTESMKKAAMMAMESAKPMNIAFGTVVSVNPLMISVEQKMTLGRDQLTLFDTSASAYILDDAQVADFETDKLCSIANAKPASGLTQNLSRPNCRNLAEHRGAGWYQSYGALISATQLLFLIEYASFNAQTKIGKGNVSKGGEGVTNMSENTGSTSSLGNASGNVINSNGIMMVSYRGEENLWGNMEQFVDGLIIHKLIDACELYVTDHGFMEGSVSEPYKNAGITVAQSNGYISAMGYNEEFDWLFFPSEVNENGANSVLPVGDNFVVSEYFDDKYIPSHGGAWYGETTPGVFNWDASHYYSQSNHHLGCRLAYIPGVTT